MNNLTVKEIIDLLHHKLCIIPDTNTEIIIKKYHQGQSYEIRLESSTEDEHGEEIKYRSDNLGIYI